MPRCSLVRRSSWRAVAYGLLSAAEEGEGDLAFATELGEPRLSQPDSGLYAYVQDANGRVIWRSPSIIASGQRPSPRSRCW